MRFHPSTVQSTTDTPLGQVWLAASPLGLCGLWFDGQRHLPNALPTWPQAPQHPVLREAAQQVQQVLRGERAGFDLALDLGGGTPFQQAVWQALLRIPRGQTASYGALARAIGKTQAVRAVGAAVGRNPLSVVVPCHRVLGADGSLTGYAGGLDRKTALLTLENALPLPHPAQKALA